MMAEFKAGDVVEMHQWFVHGARRRDSGWAQHVREFGGCYGVVTGPTDYGMGNVGPELDVRWQPSNLRYSYHPSLLKPAKRKLRGYMRTIRRAIAQELLG